jgi:hypothetical protein
MQNFERRNEMHRRAQRYHGEESNATDETFVPPAEKHVVFVGLEISLVDSHGESV